MTATTTPSPLLFFSFSALLLFLCSSLDLLRSTFPSTLATWWHIPGACIISAFSNHYTLSGIIFFFITKDLRNNFRAISAIYLSSQRTHEQSLYTHHSFTLLCVKTVCFCSLLFPPKFLPESLEVTEIVHTAELPVVYVTRAPRHVAVPSADGSDCDYFPL